ncbi:hypothetical protein Pth03_54770 [Planotetraspora thailandica]|uniref:Uncharacterized protein n=1 Tax=Planotetraspora thailandica TaxID=487172 RepID=A0A8J3V476_9ACTN|nr:DUF6069 family protein [Planotetraspora thailandica]GII57088.1 hypothetical protein Pth03_54770 [Planotetraspora thailandica]
MAAHRVRRLLAVAGASAAAVAVWALAGPVAGADLSVRLSGVVQEVGPGSVVAASLAAGLAAWASLALLERLTTRPRRNWTVLAVAALALSLTGPLGSGIGTAAVLVLTCMHLVVGAVLVPGLALSRRP